MLVTTAPYWLIIFMWTKSGIGLQLVPMSNNDVCQEAQALVESETSMKAYCIRGE